MAQPTPYTRQANFTDHSSNNPEDPHSGTLLDSEYDAIRTTLTQLLTNIALLQRDDGELANRTVGQEQLKTSVSVGVDPAIDWATATAYTVNDLVWQNGVLYICDVAHTSGTFATDLAAGNWSSIINLADEIPAVSNLFMGDVDVEDEDFTIEQADNGRTFCVDTTSGDVTATLPEISGLSNGDFYRFLIFKKVSGNSMTLARSGSDTINGATSRGFSAQYSAALLFSASGDADWKMIDLSPAGAASSTVETAANISNFKMT